MKHLFHTHTILRCFSALQLSAAQQLRYAVGLAELGCYVFLSQLTNIACMSVGLSHGAIHEQQLAIVCIGLTPMPSILHSTKRADCYVVVAVQGTHGELHEEVS